MPRLPIGLGKIKGMTAHSLARLWGHRHHHTVLVGIQTGKTFLEGNLVIPNNKTYALTLNLAIPLL